MIFGIKQSSKNTDKEYDYAGASYFEGNFGSEYRYVFVQSDISEILFGGFEDSEH